MVADVPKIAYTDPESGQQVAVDLDERMPEITLGRNPGNVIRVNNPSISRQHAKFVYDNGQCTLIDLDSSNGSYINGNRVRSQVLVDGDRVRVGEFPLDFIGNQDGETAEVDKAMLDGMLNGSSRPDFRRQTALGGFGAEPEVAEQSGPLGGWPPSNSPSYAAESSAFDFVSKAPAFHEPEPMMLDEDAFLPDDSREEIDAAELIVDEEDLLEEIPLDESSESLDTNNASPDLIAAGLRQMGEDEPHIENDHTLDDGFGAGRIGLGAVQEIDSSEVEPISIDVEPELVQDGSPELLERIRALEAERDELVDALENRASDPGGASQVQIDRLRNERDRLIEERRNLKRQISDLKANLAAAPDPEAFEGTAQQLGSAQEKVAQLEQTLEGLRAELEERDTRIASSQADVEMLRAELEDLRAQAAHGAELGEQLSGAQETLSQSQQQLQDATERIALLEGELDTARDEIQQLAGDLDLREQRAAEADAEIGDQRALLEDAEAVIRETSARLEETHALVETLEARAADLQAELDARPKNDEVDGLVNELTSTRKNLEATTAQRDELATAKASLEAELATQRQLVADIEKRHAELRKQFDDTARERDTLKTEKIAFARETDYLQVERRKLDGELRDLRKQAQKLERDDKRKKQIFAELSSDLKKLVAEKNSLQKAKEALEKELAAAPSSDAVKELETELAAAKKSIKGLEKDTSGLTRELGSLGEERDALKAKVAELEAAAGAAQEAATKLEAQLVDAEKSAADALQALEAAADGDEAEKIAGLQKKLAEAEKTLGDVILERDKLEDQLKKKKK